jgi:predicted Zn-dependent peptidase
MTVVVTAPPGAISLAGIAALLPASLTKSATRTRPDAPAPAPRAAGPVAAAATTAPPIAVERKPSPISVPELWLAWTLPGGFGDLGPTEEVLGHWVESDLRSDQFAKEEPQIRHAGAWVQAGESASVLFVRAIVADAADVPRLAQALAARVSSLWAREPEARPSFAGLRRAFETERILDEPGLPERAVKLALATALGGHPPPAADAPSSAEAVKSAAVAEFAYRNLTRERAHATFFAPTSPASGSDEARAATAAAREAAAAASATELIPGAAAWSPSQLGELLPPQPAIAVAKLPSGLTVVTARRPGAAGVAWLGFRGGYSDADPPLLVELAVRARPEAWRAAALHILPARGATRDLSFDAVEFLPAQLPEALTVLFAKATATITDWPARDDLQRRLASVASAEDPVAKKAERAFWRALFGDHRYARVVDTGELDRVARSDVDAWLGRVHNLREAALVVVGDVDAAEVQREATVLSQQFKTPPWVAGLPMPPAALVRAAGGERVLPVLTPRAGGLADIRLGCLLPPMAAGNRGRYELLAHAVESRLNTALRIDQGDGYGVDVKYERLRDGTTYLLASTFVADPTLGRTLAALRGQWQRWGRDGFDAGELNVARWRYAASLSADYASANTFAFQLLHAWGVEPALLEPRNLRPDVAADDAARVAELFATCRANAVLGLTGNELVIRRALETGWPALAPAARRAGN